MRLAFFLPCSAVLPQIQRVTLTGPLSRILRGFGMWAAISESHSFFCFLSHSIPCPRPIPPLLVRCSALPSPLSIMHCRLFRVRFRRPLLDPLIEVRSPRQRGFVGYYIWIYPTYLAFVTGPCCCRGRGAQFLLSPTESRYLLSVTILSRWLNADCRSTQHSLTPSFSERLEEGTLTKETKRTHGTYPLLAVRNTMIITFCSNNRCSYL